MSDDPAEWVNVNLTVQTIANGSAYRLAAQARNEGNTTVWIYKHCSPPGPWRERIETSNDYAFERRGSSCAGVGQCAGGPCNNSLAFTPGQSIWYNSTFDGTRQVEHMKRVRVPPGIYNWTIFMGPINKTVAVTIDWSHAAPEPAAMMPDVWLEAEVDQSGRTPAIRGLVRNHGSTTYSAPQPVCDTIGLFDAVWNYQGTVLFVRNSCDDRTFKPFPPGAVRHHEATWSGEGQMEFGEEFTLPPGHYIWELRFVAHKEEPTLDNRLSGFLHIGFELRESDL